MLVHLCYAHGSLVPKFVKVLCVLRSFSTICHQATARADRPLPYAPACRRWLRASAVVDTPTLQSSACTQRAILALWSQTPFKHLLPSSVAKHHLTKPPPFSTRRGQCQQPRSRKNPQSSLLVPSVL